MTTARIVTAIGFAGTGIGIALMYANGRPTIELVAVTAALAALVATQVWLERRA